MTEKADNLRAYWQRLLDERLRSYVVVVAASLLIIFVLGLIAGSLYAGLIPVLFGLCGLGLRWSVMPIFCVISVAWFQALPFGIPVYSPPRIDASYTHFRISDLLLVAAVIVYLISQYRLYSLAHLAVPDDRIFRKRRKNELPDLRNPDLVEEREIPQILVIMALVLIVGQFLWLILSEVVLDFRILPPFRMRESGLRRDWSWTISSRLIMFAIGFGIVIFTGRLFFWWWKLRRLNAEEAQLILADTGWVEMRREAARLETWRSDRIDRKRARLIPRAPKRKPKNQKPWLGPALGRACLTLMVAIVIALVLVCGGSYLFLRLFRI